MDGRNDIRRSDIVLTQTESIDSTLFRYRFDNQYITGHRYGDISNTSLILVIYLAKEEVFSHKKIIISRPVQRVFSPTHDDFPSFQRYDAKQHFSTLRIKGQHGEDTT